MHAILIAAVIAAAGSSPSPSPSPSPSALPSIGSVTVVTGSPQSLHRSPQAASVLDTRALRAATAPSLDQALRTIPGVDRDRSNAPFTNYGQLRLSFSGAGSDRGALFVDGIPAQDGFGGQVDWNAYPVESIVRAELLRGPGSALYGSGAIGGVLALTTLPPSTHEQALLVGSGGGVNRGGGALISTGLVGSWATSVAMSTQRFSYNVTPPALRTPVDRTAVSTADVAQIRLRHSGERATFDVGALIGDDAQQDGRPNYGFSRSVRQGSATWTTTGAASSLALTAFARSITLVNLADQTNAPGKLLYTQHVPSTDVGMRLRWDHSGTALVAERRMVTGNSDQIAANGTTQSNVAGTQRLDGVALQHTWDSPQFGAVAGVRYDAISTHALGTRTDGALSPRLDVRLGLSPAINLRAAYGTGLRAPYLNELIRSFRVGPVLQQSNPNLVPERSRSTQVGFDIATPASRFAIDYTGTIVTDAIGFATIAKNVQQRSNFGRTSTHAYIAEYESGNACTRFRAFGTVQHDRVAAGSPAQIGKRLAYVPDAAAALDVERTVRALTGSIEVSYSGPSFADDLEQQPLGTALLVGGRLTLRSSDGTALSLGVDNLTDRVYLTSIDRLGPPSSVTLRLSVPVGARTRTSNTACYARG